MKIFVSGLPRCGKTTLIKKIFESYKDRILISGFYTEEILNSMNERIGFRIFSIDLNKEFLFASKLEKSNIKYAGYNLFLENLEKVLNSIKLDSNLILIDEIGKMEMLSKRFEEFVFKILNSNINLIATLHRAYLYKFSKYGKVFWLEKANWQKIYDEILKIIQNTFLR